MTAMDFQVRIPFVELLGLELHRFEAGEAEISVALRPELTNSWEVAHGGVTMTLLDVVMAHAARAPDVAGGQARPGVVTIEMKTTFMRPGVGRLLAEAEVLHRTASMAFCCGAVFDGNDQLVAHATGTFKYMSGLPVGDRKIQRPNASD
jgi:uncharacterized protein (TIGR00369 family)